MAEGQEFTAGTVEGRNDEGRTAGGLKVGAFQLFSLEFLPSCLPAVLPLSLSERRRDCTAHFVRRHRCREASLAEGFADQPSGAKYTVGAVAWAVLFA